MDRRYKEFRFYNGTRASSGANSRSDALVRSYLARARRANQSMQDYGGSTGGRQSIGGSGMAVIGKRNTDIKNAREIFRTEGSGDLGGRANLAELRGFRTRTQAEETPAAG